MSNDELRIRVAEAFGWIDLGSTAPERGSLTWRLIGRLKGQVVRSMVPDYPADLQACAQLRASLTEEERERFVSELKYITGANHFQTTKAEWIIANASAADHCCAFLAAKGAWPCQATLPGSVYESE